MVKALSLLALLALVAYTVSAQVTADYAVQIETKVQQSPPQITLTWKPLSNTISYKIYKKSKNEAGWSATPLVSLTTADTSYVDNNVVADSAYEYQVIKQGATITATGYVYAAVKAPAIHNRGALLMLVDTSFNTPCADELDRLMRDIRGDGWEVIRAGIARTQPVTDVRTLIQNTCQANPRLKAVLLVGHIPVPYSGNIYPDGHQPDHKGAWPTDVYYADINGTWTDATVNITAATRAENDNVPGDGKWDQDFIPGDLELQVGRIDVANMPLFGKTEVQMMKDYLNRNHTYKMDSLGMIKRALIDDNFPATSYPEAFAANGWRNFNPLVGRNNIATTDLVSTLNSSPYQWAYGCGAGNHTSAANIGSTTSFTTNDVNAIFVFMFGSYFGDFDVTNNFLRAPLCSNTPALATSWSGRPNQFLHHMALGEHIGYSTLLSQNSDGNTYSPVSFANRMVHQALLGDVTLRTDYIKPAGKPVIASSATAGTTITWAASPDGGVSGYYVYRSTSEFGWYSKRSGLITGTSFVDSFGNEGTQYYMIRPAKIQATPSGNYENLGVGNVESAYCYYFGFDVHVPTVNSKPAIGIYPNPSGGLLHIAITSADATNAYITLTDLAGRKLHQETKMLTNGSNIVTAQLQHLPAGIYFITVEAGQNRYTSKWIKN